MYNTKKLNELDGNATIKNIKELFNKEVKVKKAEKYDFLGTEWSKFAVLDKKDNIYIVSVNNEKQNFCENEGNKNDFLEHLNSIILINEKNILGDISNTPAYKMRSAILKF